WGLERGGGDRRWGARGAEEVDVAVAKPAVLGHETVDQGRDLRDHRRVDFGGDLVSAVALRQRDHADGQRRPGPDLRQRRPAPAWGGPVEAHKLRGTAPHVEHAYAVRLPIHPPPLAH